MTATSIFCHVLKWPWPYTHNSAYSGKIAKYSSDKINVFGDRYNHKCELVLEVKVFLINIFHGGYHYQCVFLRVKYLISSVNLFIDLIHWGLNKMATILFISSPPKLNGRHFKDGILKYIFMNKKFCILINISLKSVPKGQFNNIPALVQITAWCQIGNKSLLEPMLTQFTDIWGTRGMS